MNTRSPLGLMAPLLLMLMIAVPTQGAQLMASLETGITESSEDLLIIEVYQVSGPKLSYESGCLVDASTMSEYTCEGDHVISKDPEAWQRSDPEEVRLVDLPADIEFTDPDDDGCRLVSVRQPSPNPGSPAEVSWLYQIVGYDLRCIIVTPGLPVVSPETS